MKGTQMISNEQKAPRTISHEDRIQKLEARANHQDVAIAALTSTLHRLSEMVGLDFLQAMDEAVEIHSGRASEKSIPNNLRGL